MYRTVCSFMWIAGGGSKVPNFILKTVRQKYKNSFQLFFVYTTITFQSLVVEGGFLQHHQPQPGKRANAKSEPLTDWLWKVIVCNNQLETGFRRDASGRWCFIKFVDILLLQLPFKQQQAILTALSLSAKKIVSNVFIVSVLLLLNDLIVYDMMPIDNFDNIVKNC